MQNLVYTEDSIVKIALDHGFANAKSFNQAFKKEYHDTPGNFRKLHQGDNDKSFSETDRIEIDLEVDLELKEFMRYVKKYEINFEQSNVTKKCYDINLADQQVMEIYPQDNILNIGKVESAGYTRLFSQLEMLRDKLGFKYVYFTLDHYFLPENIPYSMILYNQFFRTVNQLQKKNMIPLLKISPEESYKSMPLEQMKIDVENKMETFLESVKSLYHHQYVERWRIEVKIDPELTKEASALFWETVYKIVKRLNPRIKIGYYALSRLGEKEEERFAVFMKAAVEQTYALTLLHLEYFRWIRKNTLW